MLAFVGNNNIQPVVDRTYSLQQTKDALLWLEEGKQFGKIALTIA
jgi:zinc-binding alcohol dehydrogenase/oxidoreductase